MPFKSRIGSRLRSFSHSGRYPPALIFPRKSKDYLHFPNSDAKSEQLARSFAASDVGGRNHDFRKFQTPCTMRVTILSLVVCGTFGTASCSKTLTAVGASAALRGVDTWYDNSAKLSANRVNCATVGGGEAGCGAASFRTIAPNSSTSDCHIES